MLCNSLAGPTAHKELSGNKTACRTDRTERIDRIDRIDRITNLFMLSR